MFFFLGLITSKQLNKWNKIMYRNTNLLQTFIFDYCNYLTSPIYHEKVLCINFFAAVVIVPTNAAFMFCLCLFFLKT